MQTTVKQANSRAILGRFNFNKLMQVVSFAFIFLFRFVPAPAGLTADSMQMIGIFVGMLLLWNFAGIGWTSLLCMSVIVLFQIMTQAEVFASGLGNWVNSFLYAFFMISYVMTQTGLSKRIAIWSVSNKLASRGPWTFIIVFLFASVFLSAFMSQTAALLVFIPIAEELFKELGLKKGDRLPQMIILGLAMCVGIGSSMTPIGHAIVLIPLTFLARDAHINIDVLSYSIVGIATGLLVFIVFMLIYKFFYRPDVKPLRNFNAQKLRAELPPISRQEKITAAVFVAVIVIWIIQGTIGNILPDIGAYLSSIGNAIPAFIGVILLCLINVDGKPVMDFKTASTQGVPWNTLIFNAAVLVLSAALVQDKLGITKYFTKIVRPIVSDFSSFLFILVAMFLLVMLKQFISSTIMATVFYSLLIPLALTLGNINVAALTILIAAGASYAWSTPPSTIPMALAGGSGWVDLKVMLRYGLALALAGVLILSFVGYPLASMILK
ncbi:sodium:sulfate symporter [Lacticaseibacillus zeae]|uniref:Sodium-dependent dicarboxylate transporter SdcS n=1 Tax=Lacticaseibacillus zeae TaxID=57037 RepID=A0A5R8LNP5_LACZE|nr:SLC13 family permease [Lacticaseibacillus zeae]TLF38851.1 sodium:sulfate symporter [Lacticaseibacillus zeae]